MQLAILLLMQDIEQSNPRGLVAFLFGIAITGSIWFVAFVYGMWHDQLPLRKTWTDEQHHQWDHAGLKVTALEIAFIIALVVLWTTVDKVMISPSN